jgi:GTP pyrophosphokinase
VLGFVKTSHAREKIRQWFGRQGRAQNVERGKELLEKTMRQLGIKLSERDKLAKIFAFENIEDFYAAIGSGDISAHQIAQKLTSQQQQPRVAAAVPRKEQSSAVEVHGVKDLLTHVAQCCHPVPGDKIIGYVTRTKGVSVHRTDCLNIVNIDEKERLIRVAWEQKDQMYTVPVRIEAMDRVGLLRDISAVIAEEGLNITAASTSNNSVEASIISLTLETKGLGQLSQLLSKLEGVRGVISVTRLT